MKNSSIQILCATRRGNKVENVFKKAAKQVRGTFAGLLVLAGLFIGLVATIPTAPAAGPVLLVIEVTPINPSVPAGHSLQFTATATYSDGSQQDVTTSVFWSSDHPFVAQVSNASGSQGRATGLAPGTSQITAVMGSVSGSTTLTVTDATLVAIQVTPINPTVPAGHSLQFTATGTFSDGTTRDVTASVTWSSNNAAVTISNAPGSQGLATAVAPGMAQITAERDGISGSTNMTVPPEPGCQLATSISANFNGIPISQNSYIWFNSVLTPKGLGSSPATFRFVQQKITSSGFTLPVPDATVTFDPAVTTATTTFTGGVWVTRAPSTGLAGDTFLSGLTVLVGSNLPGGLKNVTWSGTVIPDTPGTSVRWHWTAGVYSTFTDDYNTLGVKPVDDNKASQYKNSDHAGTPENFTTKVLGGAAGSGMAFTDPCDATPPVVLTKSAPATTNSSQIPYTITYKNSGLRPVENLQLSDKVPAGTTYVAGSAIPAPASIAGGVLTWNLPTLPSGAVASVTFRVAVSSDGTYSNTANMRFAQAVGVISSNTVTTVRDTVAPTVTIVSGPSGATNATNPSFQFVRDSSAVGSECAIDNVGFTSCAPAPSQYTSATLPEGPHTFTVRAFDAAGNTASASRTFTVDLTPPIATFAQPPTNSTVTSSSTPRFYFTVNDIGTTTTFCSVAGDPFAPCTSPFTTRALSDGTYTVSVFARDAVGNTGPTDNFTFTIDHLPPVISIPVPPNVTTTSNRHPTFTFSDVGAAGTAVTFQCRIDGGANAPCSSPFTVPAALADGMHTFTVTGTDAANNAGQASLIFTVDTVAPIITIPGEPYNPANVSTPTPTFLFTVSNTPAATPVVASQCSVNDAASPNALRAQSVPGMICDTQFTVPLASALPDGAYTFTVKTTDAAGNVGTASLPFTVDTHAPIVSIPVPPNQTNFSTHTPQFSFDVSDTGGATPLTTQCRTYESSTSPGASVSCTSPFTAPSPLATGSYIFEVIARDGAGNVGSSFLAFTIN